ncbi:MAG: type 2 lantipeptide synthetase LanM family protein [Myxococcaceae bacterium]|nr:type 2 lantipeptide synthetase LanM family protein [Myxococcaceae bacterium]
MSEHTLVESFDATIPPPRRASGAGADAHLPPGAWSAVLEQVSSREFVDEPLPALPERLASLGDDAPPLFTGFLQPFLRVGAARLRAGISALRQHHPEENIQLDSGAEAALIHALAHQLQVQATRTLVLELHVARMLSQLPGATPQERFRSFTTTWFQAPGRLRRTLEEYPVLARLMATSVVHWADSSLELLARLAADLPMLRRTFSPNQEPGPLPTIKTGLSDLHRRGRGVVQLRFSSGLGLVYKPRSLKIDVQFQEFLRSMNSAGLRHPHRELTVLEREGYGWVEFVEPAPCDSHEAVSRFYWRQGSLLALLHLLQATDFHYENLIASGEHPVLVDLEALFHSRAPLADDSAQARAADQLAGSVLGVGLLPKFILNDTGQPGVDLSGLGGEAGQLYPLLISQIADSGQDTMKVVRRQVRTQGAHNRPSVAGAPVRPADFTEDIVQGFQETYELLMRQQAEVASQLRRFADVEVRHIVRPTRRYSTLLLESHHPDFLQDEQARSALLDHLSTEAARLPELQRVLPPEKEDLNVGDIPLFTARPGQRHLWSSRGECIPDFFARDSLGESLERLERMDTRERDRQVSLLRRSMASLGTERLPAWITRPFPHREAPRPATPEDCLAAAISVGEYLQAEAIHGRTDVCWIGMKLDSLEGMRWTLAPLNEGLYEGLGGLALFFGYLAAETGRSDFEALARSTLGPILQQWREAGARGHLSIGPFTGRASHAYVLGHLSALWNEPALMGEVLAGLPSLETGISTDTSNDLLSGAAGCAIVLLGLYGQTGDARFLEAARHCGDRLLATAMSFPDGTAGWWSPATTKKPLAGLSHGAAGVAWALLELASATGEARYRDMALRGVRYGRALFDAEHGNWLDLRTAGDTPTVAPESFPTTWCNGAPGIALGRLLSLRHLDDAETRAEITTGLERTLLEGFGGSHCLCHGDVGNIEVLHLAGEVLGEPRWTGAALEHAAEAIRQGRESGWRCGLPKFSETPGLLVGLSGIGMGLLRLASPARVPSVLSLSPGA